MKCKISDWTCLYHACMSDDCQKSHVKKNGQNWGPGKCVKKKLIKVTVLKPIPIKGINEPMPISSKIEIDRVTYPKKKREHQVFAMSGPVFGNVGDRCYSITEDELNQLEMDGIIKFHYS